MKFSHIIYFKVQLENIAPCDPNPCGSNAECIEKNGVGSCICKDNYFGDPYESCRPECVLNADCPSHLACVNNKCKDVCLGSCGQNTECRAQNHKANCICFPGYTGNPYSSCYVIQEERKTFILSFRLTQSNRIAFVAFLYLINQLIFCIFLISCIQKSLQSLTLWSKLSM